MKKPDIGKNWYVKAYHSWDQWSDEEASDLHLIDEREMTIALLERCLPEHNKAISAVPEMIDALIEARHDLVLWVKSFGGTGADTSDTEVVIQKIEQALIKAGVDF